MAKRESTTFAGGLRVLHLVAFALVVLIGNAMATQYVAAEVGYAQEFGPGLLTVGHFRLYQPFAFWQWVFPYYDAARTPFNVGFGIFMASVVIAVLSAISVAIFRSRRTEEATSHGSARWGNRKDLEKAKLLTGKGIVLGRTEDGQWITYDGPAHAEVVAPSRSGKGVGIIVPTLLNVPDSVLVHDIKGELWALTAGWRKRFSYVLRFSPAEKETCRFNPLFEVRKGEYEVRDVQNITDLIVDPDGKGKPDHWSKEGDSFLVAVVLHVLYAERDKTLAGVAYFLNHPDRAVDDTLNIMLTTRHLGDSTHPVVAMGARAMMNKSDNERSGVYSTARSFFNLYLDPIVAAATSESDFRIADLRQAEYPVSLYLVAPPSDKSRIRPAFRLLFTQILTRLTEKVGDERNVHRLLLALDELPAMGKLAQFQEGLGFYAGYGIKVLMASQSENQKTDIYGPTNTLSDGAHIKVYYAPNTEATAEKISKELGDKTELVQQKNYGGHRLSTMFGHVMVSTNEITRRLLTAGEVRELPPDDELILVAGNPPVRAKKGYYFADAPFKDMVPPTLQDLPEGDPRKGQPSDPNHPLNPPVDTGVRPYPYAPPRRPHDWQGMYVAQPKPATAAAAAALTAMQAVQAGAAAPATAVTTASPAAAVAVAAYTAPIPAGGLASVPAVNADGELEPVLSHAKTAETESSAPPAEASWGAEPAAGPQEQHPPKASQPEPAPPEAAATPSADDQAEPSAPSAPLVETPQATEASTDVDDDELLEAAPAGDEPPADDDDNYTFV